MLGAAVAIGRWVLPGASVGDVDPVGVVLGLTALAISVWTGWLTVRSLRWQETNLAEIAERLAVEALDVERTAWRQLLGDHDKAIDVQFTFYPAPTHNADGAGAEGRLEEVADYYRRLRPQRLMITGAPGAGKTVLAMQLMLRFFETRAAEDPVPVRLSLASWDTERPVEDWIAGHLVDNYRVPAAAAKALVKARRVLPVLDGLDEMDTDPEPGYASRAGRAVRALNAYQQATGKAALVLTCRSRAHGALAALGVWAHDAARVEIRPVDPGAVQQFLTDRVDNPARWQGVREVLTQDPHGPLATGLSTAWRLTLAVTVYEERLYDGTYLRDPQALLSSTLDTSEAVGKHLLGLFVPAVTARHTSPHGTVYTAEEVRAWLTVLAGYLARNTATGQRVGGRQLSGTDIVMHELWPLAGTRLPRAVTAALVAMMWLAGWVAILALLLPYSASLTVTALLTAPPIYAAWRRLWPQPSRVDLERLRTSIGRPRFPRYLVLVLVGGFITLLAGGPVDGLVFVLVFGLPAWLPAWLATGLAAPGTLGIVDPQRAVRNDFTARILLAFVLMSGFTGGLMFELAGGFVSVLAAVLAALLAVGPVAKAVGALTTELLFGFVFEHAGILKGDLVAGLVLVLAVGLVAGLAVGPAVGFTGLRYIALLLCTRHWSSRPLPWRLGRFLHWCYGAGLIRIAGTAYQFRHRELQDYLAQDPYP
jgi:hypothetical protein